MDLMSSVLVILEMDSFLLWSLDEEPVYLFLEIVIGSCYEGEENEEED